METDVKSRIIKFLKFDILPRALVVGVCQIIICPTS